MLIILGVLFFHVNWNCLLILSQNDLMGYFGDGIAFVVQRKSTDILIILTFYS